MKKLIFAIVLLMSIAIQAQTTGALKGGGITFADSLKTWRDSTGGTATYYASDSSMVINLNLDWDFVSITVKDTGTTYTDSIKVFKGFIRYDNGYAHNPQDTIWGTQALPVKNSAWNVDTVLVGAGSVKTYTILDQNIQLLEIRRANYGLDAAGGLSLGIKTDIIVQGKRTK